MDESSETKKASNLAISHNLTDETLPYIDNGSGGGGERLIVCADDNSSTTPIDDVLKEIGQFGPYQKWIFFAVSIIGLPTAINNLSPVFSAASPDFVCNDRALAFLDQYNLSAKERNWISAPVIQNIDGTPKFDQCKYYALNYANLTESEVWVMIEAARNLTRTNEADCDRKADQRATQACTRFAYDTSYYESTIVTEWNLVCERQVLKPTSTSIYMAGLMVGVFGWGQISDKLGRRRTGLLVTVFMCCLMIIAGFSTDFVMYAVVRFIMATANIASFTILFVVVIELVGPEWRAFVGVAMEFFWSAGGLLLVLFAYFIRDWNIMMIASGAPWILLVPFFYFVLPESPRWLLANGRESEARKILERIAASNGTALPTGIKLSATRESTAHAETSNGHVADSARRRASAHQTDGGRGAVFYEMLLTPNMRAKSLNTFFNWFVCSCVYYGLSLGSSSQAGDPFINVLITFIVEIPAYATAIFVLDRLGRRNVLAACHLTAGVALLLSIFVPQNVVAVRIIFSNIGKFAISAAFAVIYVFSAELMPTQLRNVGVGAGSMFARVGGVLAPYIADIGGGGGGSATMPFIIFGALAFAAGCLTLLLPETRGRELPDTLAEGEAFTRTRKSHADTQTSALTNDVDYV